MGSVSLQHHFAALPSVTPTAKPAVSPVVSKITGTVGGEDFLPALAQDGKDLTIDRFRKLLEDAALPSDGIDFVVGNLRGLAIKRDEADSTIGAQGIVVASVKINIDE